MSDFKVLAVDFMASLRIIRSVAAAEIISQAMNYSFKPTDLFKIANLRGEVGIWEANIPDGPKLRTWINDRTEELAMKAVDKAFDEPLKFWGYLTDLTDCRDSYLENIQSTMQSFQQINAATLTALNASVVLAKTGRFAANVALVAAGTTAAFYGAGGVVSKGITAAVLPQGKAVLAAPVIQLVKSLSVSAIKDWKKSGEVDQTALGFEVKKAAANEGSGQAGQKTTAQGLLLMGASNTDAEHSAKVADAAQERLRRMQKQRIGGQSVKGARKWKAKIAQQGKVAAEAQKAAEQEAIKAAAKREFGRRMAQVGRFVSHGSMTIFGAWDLYDAIGELSE